MTLPLGQRHARTQCRAQSSRRRPACQPFSTRRLCKFLNNPCGRNEVGRRVRRRRVRQRRVRQRNRTYSFPSIHGRDRSGSPDQSGLDSVPNLRSTGHLARIGGGQLPGPDSTGSPLEPKDAPSVVCPGARPAWGFKRGRERAGPARGFSAMGASVRGWRAGLACGAGVRGRRAGSARWARACGADVAVQTRAPISPRRGWSP